MKFDLVLYGEEYSGAIIRTFEGLSLPRVGEEVDFFGEDLQVDRVIHNFREGVIKVLLQDDLPTWMLCDAFLSCTGWGFDGYSDEDIKEFMEAVEERKREKNK